MPTRPITGTDLEYYLIAFDADNAERREPDGGLLSNLLLERLSDSAAPVTDILFLSHGWPGDLPAAIDRYDRWIDTLFALSSDREAIRRRRSAFKPLIIGLHWPSLPWSDQTTPTAKVGVLSDDSIIEAQVDAYAARIADTPKARGALRAIFEEAAGKHPDAATLSPRLLTAYASLFAESGLQTGDQSGRPGADQDPFDPAAIYVQARGDTLLTPLRQLSFWKMQDRARRLGETSGHNLLGRLQAAAPKSKFHLMGHSFGCIVQSAAVAGPPGAQRLPRPVDSMFLVQGPLSLSSYARDLVSQQLVRGPIITTRSTHDKAVRHFYRLRTPDIQGNRSAHDLTIQPLSHSYDFRDAHIYNLDASRVIRNGSGPSGAHSDIAHPEVAHAFWAAILGSTLEPNTRGIYIDPEVTIKGNLSEEPRGESRWINAELEDHPPRKPLEAGKWYTLAFDVDLLRRATAVATATLPLPDLEQLFPRGVDEIRLTVQVDSTDFDVSDHIRSLRLPRDGRGYTKARFDISPLHGGPSRMKVTIHKEGNFIQQMALLFDVGATSPTQVQTTTRGRPVSAASVLLPRDISLTLSPVTGGYECIITGAVAARAMLPLLPGALESAVDVARRELLKVVMYTNASGQRVFQSGIDIAPAYQEFALKTMARAGALLFQKLFSGPAAREDSRKLGQFLREVANDRSRRLKLQIVAESTPLPWGLLYIGDASTGAQLEWDHFLGMRHIIEQIPLQNTLAVSDCVMSSEPDLALSINFNSTIDAQLQADLVGRQRSFWASTTTARRSVRMTGRETRNEVIRALADATTDDQILYFYCHAASTGLSNGGPDASCLVLSDASITLGDLKLDAPPTTQLRGKPLVFINACDSADLSPAFYDGFVPYFMDKGARGVIGTECKTPALFATEWAQRFFMRFLDGESLGETFLGLRREFLEKHGNPLGLLYAVYCNGDTVIRPALTSA